MLGALPLPIPPSSLEITTPSMNKTVVLINEGEINIPKDQGLREISFEFLIPTFQKYPFATYQLDKWMGSAMIPLLKLASPVLDTAKKYAGDILGSIGLPKDGTLGSIAQSAGGFLDSILSIPDVGLDTYRFGTYTAGMIIPIIDTMKKRKQTFPFIVVRMSPKGTLLYYTYIKCVIEEFTYTEDAEEYGFDTMCSIRLKEYKDYATKRIKIKEVKQSNKPGSNKSTTTTKKATVEKKRDSSDKVKSPTIKVNKGETIISEARKNGDSIVQTAIENGIKIPESIVDAANGNISDNPWMGEIFTDLETNSVETNSVNDIQVDLNKPLDKSKNYSLQIGLLEQMDEYIPGYSHDEWWTYDQVYDIGDEIILAPAGDAKKYRSPNTSN